MRPQLRLVALCGLVLLLSPKGVSAQFVVRQAFLSFPADTQQIVYTNLAQLRTHPQFPYLIRLLVPRPLRGFVEFLRAMGVSPETDVDEIVQGWRGEPVNFAAPFGLAEGRFQTDRVRKLFAQQQLSVREYSGQELYAFGSGEDRDDLFFTFLSPSLAAFGRRSELKAILDVRQRVQPALDGNSAFLSWEAEVEGTATQWGVATGKAAASMLLGSIYGIKGKLPFDLTAWSRPLEAVLFRIDWGQDFSLALSLICQNPEGAERVMEALSLVRQADQANVPAREPGLIEVLSGLEVFRSGSRVELHLSGTLETLESLLSGISSGLEQ